MDKLSRRELECARMAARAQTNEQIAEALGLTGKTVQHHLTQAYRVLGFGPGCNQRVSLALAVIEQGREREGC